MDFYAKPSFLSHSLAPSCCSPRPVHTSRNNSNNKNVPLSFRSCMCMYGPVCMSHILYSLPLGLCLRLTRLRKMEMHASLLACRQRLAYACGKGSGHTWPVWTRKAAAVASVTEEAEVQRKGQSLHPSIISSSTVTITVIITVLHHSNHQHHHHNRSQQDYRHSCRSISRVYTNFHGYMNCC